MTSAQATATTSSPDASEARAAPAPAPVLFFDGVCNFCDGSVQFLLRHEAAPTLRFASLQSQAAEKTLPPFGIEPSDLDSLVLVEDDRVHTRSTAALRAARYLKAPWRWLSVFLLVPKPVRDFFYKTFARNRYRLFGKKDACMIPAPEVRARFL